MTAGHGAWSDPAPPCLVNQRLIFPRLDGHAGLTDHALLCLLGG